MSGPKNLGELHLCRNSYLTIRTPDHRHRYMVVVGRTGNLSFLRAYDEEQTGLVFAKLAPDVEKEPNVS